MHSFLDVEAKPTFLHVCVLIDSAQLSVWKSHLAQCILSHFCRQSFFLFCLFVKDQPNCWAWQGLSLNLVLDPTLSSLLFMAGSPHLFQRFESLAINLQSQAWEVFNPFFNETAKLWKFCQTKMGPKNTNKSENDWHYFHYYYQSKKKRKTPMLNNIKFYVRLTSSGKTHRRSGLKVMSVCYPHASCLRSCPQEAVKLPRRSRARS